MAAYGGTPGTLYMMGLRVARTALHLLLQPQRLLTAEIHRRRQTVVDDDWDSHQISIPRCAKRRTRDELASRGSMNPNDGAALDMELGENGANKSNAQEECHVTELGALG